MGQSMCRRLLEAGTSIVVYDVNPSARQTLFSVGAESALSVAQACAESDVVITMLAQDDVVQEVVLGAGGMRESLRPGSIHLAMGTYSVQTIRLVEAAHTEAHQVLVASPVLGRPDMAATGQLGLVVAGPSEAVNRCEPLLKILGRRAFTVGVKPEHATAIKLANSFLLGCAIQSM